MAYGYNLGFSVPPGGSAFGGFLGGITQIPGGIIPPPPSTLIGPGEPRFLGDDLPSVDPFNYPGVIHFGPSFTIIGPHPPNIPPGGGIYNPYLSVPGVPSINMGVPGVSNMNMGIPGVADINMGDPGLSGINIGVPGIPGVSMGIPGVLSMNMGVPNPFLPI